MISEHNIHALPEVEDLGNGLVLKDYGDSIEFSKDGYEITFADRQGVTTKVHTFGPGGTGVSVPEQTYRATLHEAQRRFSERRRQAKTEAREAKRAAASEQPPPQEPIPQQELFD